MTPLRVAVAGLGTVGAEVCRLLGRQQDLIAARAGRPIAVVAVSARDRAKDRGLDLARVAWHDDPVALAGRDDVDVVAELIGGADGPARALVEAALAAGRHVVTANKAMLAHHGTALARAAEAKGVALSYEAAVAGGIPIIKALREGLAANRIDHVYGILNGTSNYILTTMRESGRSFEAVLGEAQRLGYAEADPSFDVDGVDAAHKLAVLAAAAFGREVDFAGVHVEGIRHVAPEDFAYADQLGYRIKLLGIARDTEHGIEQRVHPCLVPVDAPIAQVDGVFNAVVVEGDAVGTTMYLGRGAGAGPTASAVVADLVDIAAGRRTPAFGRPAAGLEPMATAPIDRHEGAYYIRLLVVDRPGVMADIAAILRDTRVSIESMIQRGRDPDQPVTVVLTTHDTNESALRRALDAMEALDTVLERPRMMRVKAL